MKGFNFFKNKIINIFSITFCFYHLFTRGVNSSRAERRLYGSNNEAFLTRFIEVNVCNVPSPH